MNKWDLFKYRLLRQGPALTDINSTVYRGVAYRKKIHFVTQGASCDLKYRGAVVKR